MLKMNNKTIIGIILVLANCLGAGCSTEDERPYPVPSQPVDKKFDISQKIADDWMKQYNASIERDLKRIGEELKRKNKLQQLVEKENQLLKRVYKNYALTPEQGRAFSKKLDNLALLNFYRFYKFGLKKWNVPDVKIANTGKTVLSLVVSGINVEDVNIGIQ